MWVGNNQGGYEYDESDGYKMGLKAVTVNITINAPGGIDHVCKSGVHGQGIVKMVVDNYDIQKGISPRTAIVLNDPIECTSDPNAGNAIWTGTIYMHYWEKPGMYTVHAEAISCCGTIATDEETSQYTQTAALCMAPPGKRVTYGNAQSCVDKNSTAMGDVIMSTCDQCDIGSAPATIRNIGNAVVNTLVTQLQQKSGVKNYSNKHA